MSWYDPTTWFEPDAPQSIPEVTIYGDVPPQNPPPPAGSSLFRWALLVGVAGAGAYAFRARIGDAIAALEGGQGHAARIAQRMYLLEMEEGVPGPRMLREMTALGQELERVLSELHGTRAELATVRVALRSAQRPGSPWPKIELLKRAAEMIMSGMGEGYL